VKRAVKLQLIFELAMSYTKTLLIQTLTTLPNTLSPYTGNDVYTKFQKTLHFSNQ